jgi:sterol 3beta-glucosyltransferase
MHITIAALGTQGDVQPLVALGKGLQSAGHKVLLVTGENFVTWVRSQGLECVGTVDIMAIMQSPEGLAIAENPRKQVAVLKGLIRQHGSDMIAPFHDIAPHTDVILSGFSFDHFAQMICEKYGIRQISVPLQPYYPSRSGAATMMTPFPRRNSLVNLWIGNLFQSMTWGVSGETTNELRSSIGLPPHTAKSYKKYAREMSVVCGFSRHVIPPPTDWGAQVQIAGYWFLDHPADYQPPAPLAEFLAAGEKPVYIGFGSMVSREPEATFHMMCDALERAGQRGVLATGWNDVKTQTVPRHVFVLDSVPHSWLFPRMVGVVHHGGAGTAAAGLRAGVPSLLIPHSVDQPYWARRLRELGVSARPIPRKKLTAEGLAQGIRALVQDSALRERAAALGDLIRAEQGVANAVSMIEQAARKQ